MWIFLTKSNNEIKEINAGLSVRIIPAALFMKTLF